MNKGVKSSVAVAFAVFVLLGVAVWIFIHSADYTLTEKNFSKGALRVVEASSNLKLVDGARGLNMIYVASKGNPYLVAEIEIPADAGESMRRQIEIHGNEEYHMVDPPSVKVSWWKFGKMDVVGERHYTVGNSYVHVVLCRDSQTFKLFVESMYL